MRQSSNFSNPKEAKLFFSNISFNADEIDIFDLFGQHGKINDIEILRDKSGRSRGSGFIEFADPSSNQKAVNALNGKLFKDSLLHVEIIQTNLSPNNHERQNQDFQPSIETDFNQSKIESQGKTSYFPNSNLNDLPSLPPPPPIYPMDQIPLTSRTLSLSAPPSTNEPSNDHQKKHGGDNNYSGSEYEYNYYDSDYYSSDYYYTNTESDEEHSKHNQDTSQISQTIPPINPYQLNSNLPEYDSNYSNLALPLNPPPPLPPIPSIMSPFGAPNTLTPNSSSTLINHYAQSSRNSGLSLPPQANERNVPPQNGIIPPGYDIPAENNFSYGISASASSPSSIIQAHEHHHRHRNAHERENHTIRNDEYDSKEIDTTSIHLEPDQNWMVMPPHKDDPYWKNKRAAVIEELKKAAYEEIRKNSSEK